MNFIKIYIVSLLVLFPIDTVWLTLSKNLYNNWLSPFQRVLNIPAAFLVYLIIPFGLCYFVISKNAGVQPNTKIIFDAFLYGVCSYAVYDLTNLATLKNWSIPMTIVDILWGGILCAIVTYFSLHFLQKV